MIKFFSAKFVFIVLISFVLFFSPTSSVNSQGYDSADGHGGGGNDSSAAYSGGIDQTSDKSAANADSTDFSSGNDFGSSNAGNSDFGDYSTDNSNGSFSDFVTTLDPAIGLGNEAGVDSNPGGPAPLSNQNHTVDSAGATATADSSDTGYNCEVVNCTEPVLTGTTSCIGSVPVVNLSWSGNSTNVRYWHLLKAKEPNPAFAQLISYWYTDYAGSDKVLEPNKIYYYGIFGSNSGDGTNYSGRTPLSNILAVYTPSCAPVVAAVCSDFNPGSIQKLSVSWQNNDPTASGYKIYRGTNASVASRTYLPPNHSPVVNNYSDESVLEGTTYNYWFKSFHTIYHPPYQEITSTDENGNPTGFIDHPGYYEDVESQFSGMSAGVSPQACQQTTTNPPVTTPTVQLTITTPEGTFPDTNIPVTVRQNDPVTIAWQISNATDATASSNPVLNSWHGPVNPVSGTSNISTSTVGTYLLNLNAVNESNTTSNSVQLNIKPVYAPYIQTTQGDVHSNSDINVPE